MISHFLSKLTLTGGLAGLAGGADSRGAFTTHPRAIVRWLWCHSKRVCGLAPRPYWVREMGCSMTMHAYGRQRYSPYGVAGLQATRSPACWTDVHAESCADSVHKHEETSPNLDATSISALPVLKTAAMPAGYGAVQGLPGGLYIFPALLRCLSPRPDRSNARHGHGRRGAVRRDARCPSGGIASRPTNSRKHVESRHAQSQRVQDGDLLLGRLRCPARHCRPRAQTVGGQASLCMFCFDHARIPCLELVVLILPRCTVVSAHSSACLASGLGASSRPGKWQGTQTCLRRGVRHPVEISRAFAFCRRCTMPTDRRARRAGYLLPPLRPSCPRCWWHRLRRQRLWPRRQRKHRLHPPLLRRKRLHQRPSRRQRLPKRLLRRRRRMARLLLQKPAKLNQQRSGA